MNEIEQMPQELWTRILSMTVKIWNLQLFKFDGEPLTVGKMVLGVILLFVGYYVSRRGTEAVDRKFLAHMKIEASLRYSLRRLTFYTFMVISTLTVLRILNVPITIFTVIGGALAIGIGFGSQNIVSNFISGLIMMIEQPIRVGDFVEAEGFKGTVEMIGTRSTLIRSVDNKMFIVPNSVFLEKVILNWTIEQGIVRSEIAVGVNYGASVELVQRLLREAVEAQDGVMKEPAVRVIFSDFGDNALIFKVFFWCPMTHNKWVSERESEIRARMVKLFNQHGVNFPFPQRDLHLHTERPIHVQVSQ